MIKFVHQKIRFLKVGGSFEYLLILFFSFTFLTSLNAQENSEFDLVLLQGRVMDPESGLDGVRNIGIQDGRIVAVSVDPLRGQNVIDVEGLVVAPGFIDLHAHGQDTKSRRFQARDGVTTALDMEAGVFPVASWYASHEGRTLINFGATVGHAPVRIALMYGKEYGHLLTNKDAMQDTALFKSAAVHRKATPEEIQQLATLLRQGLNEGALGIGFAIQYMPGAKREEILELFGVATENNVACYVHTRSIGEVEPGSSIEAVQEVIAAGNAIEHFPDLNR